MVLSPFHRPLTQSLVTIPCGVPPIPLTSGTSAAIQLSCSAQERDAGSKGWHAALSSGRLQRMRWGGGNASLAEGPAPTCGFQLWLVFSPAAEASPHLFPGPLCSPRPPAWRCPHFHLQGACTLTGDQRVWRPSPTLASCATCSR